MGVDLIKTLKGGYELAKKRKEVTWISLVIIISAIPMNLLRLFRGPTSWILIAMTTSVVIGTYFYGSMIRMYQKRRRRKNVLKRSILDMKTFFPIFLLTTLVTGLLTYLGMLLLIIPGLIVLTKLLFAPITVVSEELGTIESLKRSWSLSKGHEVKIFLTILTLFAITWAISLIKLLPMITGLSSVSLLASFVIYEVILLFFLPFFVAVTYNLYEEIESNE